MLRQPRIQASRASPAQKSRGLRVVLFQKLFQGYIFCFLGDSFGWCIFEQYAVETNLKKKHSVALSERSLYYWREPVRFLIQTQAPHCDQEDKQGVLMCGSSPWFSAMLSSPAYD